MICLYAHNHEAKILNIYTLGTAESIMYSFVYVICRYQNCQHTTIIYSGDEKNFKQKRTII